MPWQSLSYLKRASEGSDEFQQSELSLLSNEFKKQINQSSQGEIELPVSNDADLNSQSSKYVLDFTIEYRRSIR